MWLNSRLITLFIWLTAFMPVVVEKSVSLINHSIAL